MLAWRERMGMLQLEIQRVVNSHYLSLSGKYEGTHADRESPAYAKMKELAETELKWQQ